MHKIEIHVVTGFFSNSLQIIRLPAQRYWKTFHYKNIALRVLRIEHYQFSIPKG